MVLASRLELVARLPNTLHRNLLSTNAIENSFRNTRRKIGRVTRFRAETDQATRWLAFTLTEVEKGFRRISGHADLPSLITALEKQQKVSRRKFPTGLGEDIIQSKRNRKLKAGGLT